jgi:hypothetical protein
VERSTLVLIPRGATIAELTGELEFSRGIVLRVLEIIDFAAAVIEYYSYEVYEGSDRLYWYDPQPHPSDLALASTHPHHRHVPPDIKHHRMPAPGLSFEHPNLPFLIHEIEQILLLRAV